MTRQAQTIENPKSAIRNPQLKLLDVPVTSIRTVPSGNNPRTINVKSKSFEDLLGSVRAQGVVVPVHGRIHPMEAGKYEVLAGERRLVAATMAELKSIPAVSHGQISDEEAFEIMFIENFAREDLSVLEQ